MPVPLALASTSHEHPLLQSLSPLRSRLSARKARSRVERNAALRASQLKRQLPDAIRQFQEDNPECHGLPRSYKIRFDDVPDATASDACLNGARITFGQFGNAKGVIRLNDHVIEPHDAVYHPALKTYTINAPVARRRVKVSHGPASVESVTAHFNFDAAKPVGTIGIGAATFNVTLDQEPLMFNVDVSADAGAVVVKGALKWDVNSDKWKNATWETGKMQFGYDLVTRPDPATGKYLSHVENVFIDNYVSNSPTKFALGYDDYGKTYTSIMDGKSVSPGSLMQTVVTDLTRITKAPPERKTNSDPIHSVFPSNTLFQFNEFGDSFVGAYQDKASTVYAVRAQVVLDWDVATLPSLTKPSKQLAAHSLTLKSMMPTPMPKPTDKDSSTSSDIKAASKVAAVAAAAPPSLSLNALMTYSPMVADAKDPSGYRDDVSARAMEDFHQIIVYYMDQDLRETFISATPPNLDTRVKAIADGDPAAKAFYNKLQVPYLSAFLGSTPVADDTQKHINVARAEQMLKEIPANDPVYASQTQKLYNMRFVERFPGINDYLNDQKKDYKTQIDSMSAAMQKDLADQAKGLGGDPNDKNWEHKAEYDKCIKDIVDMAKWATSKRLYWAMYLYYSVQKTTLRNWYTQVTTGGLSSSVGMSLKLFNSLFGMLEGMQVNKDGPNFMAAFNQSVQLFQMSAVVPQMVDASGNITDLDSIIKECLNNFYLNNKGSEDDKMKQQVADAMKLWQDDELRKNFVMTFAETQRLLGSMGTWYNITTMFEQTVSKSPWFTKLNNAAGYLSMMGTLISVGVLALPILRGGFGNMSGTEIALWTSALVKVATKAIVAVAKGIIRINAFWSDVAGFGNSFKLILGRGSIMEEVMPLASQRISNSVARYFMKSKANAKYFDESTRMLAKEGEELTATEGKLQKMFGRNIDELVGTVVGVIMSIVTIVLTSIDLAKEKDPLMIASDVFMLASAAVQLLAIASGWVVAYFAAEGAIAGSVVAFSAFELVATWGGPVGIALALVGMVIFIVWICLQDHRSPLQKFIDDYVKPANLYMKYLAIDYFANVPRSPKQPIELVGISIKPATTFLSGSVTTTAYMHITDPPIVDKNKIPPAEMPTLDLKTALSYSLGDVWGINTDGSGNTIFTAACEFRNPDAGGIGDALAFYCLAMKADNKGVEMIRQPDKADANYATLLKRCQWVVDPLTEPTLEPAKDPTPVTDPKAPKPAPEKAKIATSLVSIRQGQNYLTPLVDKGNAATGIGLRDLSVMSPLPLLLPPGWLLQMQPMGPGDLGYDHNPWKLVTSTVGESNYPTFSPTIGSRGMKWEISPALDAPFELVQGSGDGSAVAAGDEGCIKMKDGATFSGPMPSKTYKVTCTLNVPGAPAIVRTTTVAIQVDQALVPDEDDV